MPTIRQKKVAKKLIEAMALPNPPTGGQIVESSGYGKSMSLYPGRVIDTEGVREAMTELGFSEEGAKSVVQEILYDKKAKHHDRLDAAEKVFKVHGTYAPEKSVNLNVEVVAPPEIKDLTKKLNDLYKEGGIS